MKLSLFKYIEIITRAQWLRYWKEIHFGRTPTWSTNFYRLQSGSLTNYSSFRCTETKKYSLPQRKCCPWGARCKAALDQICFGKPQAAFSLIFQPPFWSIAHPVTVAYRKPNLYAPVPLSTWPRQLAACSCWDAYFCIFERHPRICPFYPWNERRSWCLFSAANR